jgi:hypothetical protein
MSREEMQRTMQFLLHPQARFDTLMEQLSGKVDRMADGLVGLTGLREDHGRKPSEASLTQS